MKLFIKFCVFLFITSNILARPFFRIYGDNSREIVRYDKGSQASRVVVHNGIAYLSGEICPIADANVQEQTRYILTKIDKRLAQIGTNKSRLLSAYLIVSDINYHSDADAVWMEWIDPENPPARVSFATALGRDTFKVEIQVIAALN